MSNITARTDPVQTPRLCTLNEARVMESHYAAKQAEINQANRYLHLQQEIEQELNKKYPNHEFIANCKKIQESIYGYYQRVYGI